MQPIVLAPNHGPKAAYGLVTASGRGGYGPPG